MKEHLDRVGGETPHRRAEKLRARMAVAQAAADQGDRVAKAFIARCKREIASLGL